MGEQDRAYCNAVLTRVTLPIRIGRRGLPLSRLTPQELSAVYFHLRGNVEIFKPEHSMVADQPKLFYDVIIRIAAFCDSNKENVGRGGCRSCDDRDEERNWTEEHRTIEFPPNRSTPFHRRVEGRDLPLCQWQVSPYTPFSTYYVNRVMCCPGERNT